VNTYEVTASFRPNHNSKARVEWKGHVDAANREHAMLVAGIAIAHEHGGLVAASLKTTVTRLRGHRW
jgi:hypothetical protein